MTFLVKVNDLPSQQAGFLPSLFSSHPTASWTTINIETQVSDIPGQALRLEDANHPMVIIEKKNMLAKERTLSTSACLPNI